MPPSDAIILAPDELAEYKGVGGDVGDAES